LCNEHRFKVWQRAEREGAAFIVLGSPRLQPDGLRRPVNLLPLEREDLRTETPASGIGEGDDRLKRGGLPRKTDPNCLER
jgi:hypothetical protein